jgi:uncharacterized membrane protein YozB (DUF420 family)
VWNTNWSYQQELQLPIKTNDSVARFQPIDLRISFENPCWTENENVTSLRVVCWDGTQWHELESQIYDLDQRDASHLKECNVVFLVPTFANGNERYFIYYDDSETSPPQYTDHVSVEDASYSYSPISDISAEAKFYGIREDGFCVYGVGQEGQLLDRACSQVVVKQKKHAKEFDVLGSDQIVSFAFSYYYGSREKDESSSDQVLVDKKVFVDGNLMVEFGIISESKKKDIQTIAIYTYYYFPGEEKRIDVQVKHQMLKEATVQGIDNVDGRFGSIISIKSRSAAVESMNFGEIYPYLDFYSENDDIEEYQMNLDPATKEREWIISFKDDADLGKNAWMCYGEGKEGNANAVIFSSNEEVVTSGTDERDGIQIKVAEKEYFNFLGTEVDYSSINFGRNSYEPGFSHDMMIPSDLKVQFDAEVFSSETGGYPAVEKEAQMYQTLVKSRRLAGDVSFERQQKRYNVTVITHFGGTHFTFPWLANRTSRGFPVMWIELYRDGQLTVAGAANRSFFIRASKTFSGVGEGEYFIKVYWKQGNTTKLFTGATVVSVDKNTTVHVFCTWERVITVTFKDQHGRGVSGIYARLLNNKGVSFDENISQANGELIVKAPYNPGDPYTLQAVYKDFIVYDKELQKTFRKLEMQVDLELYNVTVEVTDALDLPPGVDLSPMLVTLADNRTIQLTPQDHGKGMFFFEGIPPGEYTLQISYGNVVDETHVKVPNGGDIVQMKFTASLELTIDLFDSHGNQLDNSGIQFEILRDDEIVFRSEDTTFSLPPAHYTIKAYAEEELIGTKEVEFTNDRHLTFVTTISSLLPTIIIGLLFVFLCFLFVLTIMKKFSLPSLLKCLAIFLVVLALFQPWWEFNGTSTIPAAERNTAMYVNPGVMIETTTYTGVTSLDIAEMPDIFLAFLGAIVPIAVMVCLVLGLSIIIKKLKKKHYAFMLCIGGIILLIFLLPTFYYGTAKLTETSIGAVQGEGTLAVSIGSEEVLMQSHWGFSSGFYCILIATVIAVIALVLEIRMIMKKRTSLSTQNSTQK